MRRICKLPTKWPQESNTFESITETHLWYLWLLDLIRLSIIWTWLVLAQVSVLRTHKDLLTEPLRAIISPLELIVVVSLLLKNEVSQTPRNCHIQHRSLLTFFCLCHSWLSEKKRNEKITPTCKYNVHFLIQELPTTLLVSNDYCPALPPRLPNQSNMAFISPVPPALP